VKATLPLPTQARTWTIIDPAGHPVPSELRRPSVDEETEAVLEQAVASLGALRGLEWLGDDGVVLHLLASLIAQAEHLLGKAVTGALDQDYAWADLARLLGTSEADAHQRFMLRP